MVEMAPQSQESSMLWKDKRWKSGLVEKEIVQAQGTMVVELVAVRTTTRTPAAAAAVPLTFESHRLH